ncbi:tetratricopeptide repeat protein [Streptomyces sp. NPDC051662]|uniref:tetratricopeptide repeat protein n=1 Tax=Streptomyces sp. NPDC051662 TaxID=3154750 RepID=UPI003432ADB7
MTESRRRTRNQESEPNVRLKNLVQSTRMRHQEIADGVVQEAEADGCSDVERPHRTRVSHWINDGEQPPHPIPHYLARLLTRRLGLAKPLSPADIGLDSCSCHVEHPPPPPLGAPGQEGDPTKRRTALTILGATALTSLTTAVDTARGYTQHATATDLGPDDIADLEVAVHQLGSLYSVQPPEELRRKASADRHHAFVLQHERRHTIKEGRELARHAGMLSVILAWIAHDRGQTEAVAAYCDDAWEQGKQAGTLEVGAWAEDVRCTDALYDNRPIDALAAATRGLSAAPPRSDVAIRLTSQIARVHAKLHNQDEFAAATAKAHQYREAIPLHGTGLFAVDGVRIVSYDASSYGWLGEHDRARKAALEAIGCYRGIRGPHTAPTRLAIAQLDLALAYSSLGEPEAAVHTAREALGAGRLVQSVRGRAKQLNRKLRIDHPTHPEVIALSEEVRLLTAPSQTRESAI